MQLRQSWNRRRTFQRKGIKTTDTAACLERKVKSSMISEVQSAHAVGNQARMKGKEKSVCGV